MARPRSPQIGPASAYGAATMPPHIQAIEPMSTSSVSSRGR
eukprot:CAMPEP_0204178474 /NCGR_PEP_ID=MMETSP0361-20130328/49350_1 /ASSEMBLY_ACC=CAM_ASM_000343 /TAXON_ID=268821 /ORGANISM="Scrippsiella Hangoei, Strain SHTV-5" /LENGTH=40 /DNA_ID= /DNA_START= /DNA_END= /DNA_ORIENTATION=